MEAVRTLEDFIENAPTDMVIDPARVSRDIEPVPYEELVDAVVYWQRIKKGALRGLKEAEERLAKRLTIEGKSSVSVPGFDVVYDYPEKQLWDVEELMAMTGQEDTDTLLRIVFSKVTSGQLKAIRDRLESEDDDTIKEIIESAERTGRGDKKRLTVEARILLAGARGGKR